MRRIIVIGCVCCSIGLMTSDARSQQRGMETTKPRVGLLGRLLGLKKLPNPQSAMQSSRQTKPTAGQIHIGPTDPAFRRSFTRPNLQTRTRTRLFGSGRQADETVSSTEPMIRITPAQSQPAAAPQQTESVALRRVSRSGRTVSSFTPTIDDRVKTEQRPTRSQSLANVLRNRQSQPLNEVTRKARPVLNPFTPGRDDVYQPIASGPVPAPIETLLVDDSTGGIAPTPQTLTVPTEVADAAAKPGISPTARPQSAGRTEPSVAAASTVRAGDVAVAQTVEPTTVATAPTTDIAPPGDERFAVPEQPKSGADESGWRMPIGSASNTQRPGGDRMYPVNRTSAPAFATTRSTPVLKEPINVAGRTTSRQLPSRQPVARQSVPQRPAPRMSVPPKKQTEAARMPEIIAQVPDPAPQMSITPGPDNPLEVASGPAARRQVGATSAIAVYEPVSRRSQQQASRGPNVREVAGRARIRLGPPVPANVENKDAPQTTSASTSRATTRNVAPKAHAPIQPTVGRIVTTELRKTVQPAARTRSVSILGPRNRSRFTDRSTARKLTIAARGNLSGFKGFCPVELRDNRRLMNSTSEFTATVGNRTYQFSSEHARLRFVRSPERYIPAAGGHDVVVLREVDTELQGRLDFAAWYRGKLFLFTTQKTLDAFNATPERYADRF